MVVGVGLAQLADVLVQVGGVVPVAVVAGLALDQLFEHRDGFTVALQAVEDQALARQHAAILRRQFQCLLHMRQGQGELAFLEVQRGQPVMADGEIRGYRQRFQHQLQGAIRLAELLCGLGDQLQGLGLVWQQAQGLLETGQSLLGGAAQLLVAEVFPPLRGLGALGFGHERAFALWINSLREC